MIPRRGGDRGPGTVSAPRVVSRGVEQTLDFVLRHGYALLFGFVLGEQLGLPIPAAPVLMAAGALGAMGRLSLAPALGLAVIASLGADFLWYQVGKHRGPSILGLLCRISLEPDSCVRRTEDIFLRHGARALLVAKFIPGFSTAAPPLAGVIGMSLPRFLLFSAGGALSWAGAYVALGYVFSSQLEVAAEWLSRLGTGLGVLLGGALAAYIAWKYIQRQRFLRQLRIARITPEDLRARFERGEALLVVDLRSDLQVEGERMKLPGALHVHPDELEARHTEIPRDREIVLYCS